MACDISKHHGNNTHEEIGAMYIAARTRLSNPAPMPYVYGLLIARMKGVVKELFRVEMRRLNRRARVVYFSPEVLLAISEDSFSEDNIPENV